MCARTCVRKFLYQHNVRNGNYDTMIRVSLEKRRELHLFKNIFRVIEQHYVSWIQL